MYSTELESAGLTRDQPRAAAGVLICVPQINVKRREFFPA